MMSQWCVRRSSSAVVILASVNALGHSPNDRLRGDKDRGAIVEAADEVEQQLAAGLGERQIAEFVENDEVRPSQVIGEPALPAITGWACPQTGSRQGPWPAEVWRR